MDDAKRQRELKDVKRREEHKQAQTLYKKMQELNELQRRNAANSKSERKKMMQEALAAQIEHQRLKQQIARD